MKIQGLLIALLCFSAICEENTRLELLSTKDHFALLEHAENISEKVKCLENYISQLEYLEKIQAPTKAEKELLVDLKDRNNLNRLLKSVNTTKAIYKQDSSFNPRGRGADLRILEDVIRSTIDRLGNDLPAVDIKKEKITLSIIDQGLETELEGFINRLIIQFKEEKYIEIARNELDYQQEIPEDAWAKLLPEVCRKLQVEAQGGGISLLESLLVKPRNWYIDSNRIVVLYQKNNPKYTYVRCSKSTSGKWRLLSFSTGIPKELKE